MQEMEHGEKKPSADTLRRNYSVDQLMLLSKSPLSRRCPSALSLEGAKANSNPWLFKLVASAQPPPAAAPSSLNGEPPAPVANNGAPEGRGSYLRQDSNISDSGISLAPQRRSFTTGCQPAASAASPQKILIRNQAGAFVTKEVPARERDFRENERDRDNYPSRNNYNSRDYPNNRGGTSSASQRYGFHNDRFNRDRNNQDRGDFRRPDRFDRDHRDNTRDNRENFDRGRPSNHGDKQEESPYYLEHSDEDEPAWMEDGPSSRHDIMELKGFDDDLRGTDDAKDEETHKEAPEKTTSVENVVKKPAPPETKAVKAESPPVIEDRNANAAGGSRFSALFSGLDVSSERSQAEASAPGYSPQQEAVFGMDPQEAGRNLLQMLQRKAQVVPVASAVSQPKFKTMEDIEREHQLAQQQQHQQQLQSAAPPPPLTQSRFMPPPAQQPLHAPFTAVSPPSQPPQPSPPLPPDLAIPDDPSLHKLLNFSVQELTHMRDSGHFDHGILLMLIQMKQRKDSLMKALEIKPGGGAPPPGMTAAGGPFPAPFQTAPPPAVMHRSFSPFGNSMPPGAGPAQYAPTVPPPMSPMHRFAHRIAFGGPVRVGPGNQMAAAHGVAPAHFPPNLISHHPHPSFPHSQPFPMPPPQEMLLWQQQQQQQQQRNAAHSRQLAERQEWMRQMQLQQQQQQLQQQQQYSHSRMHNQMSIPGPAVGGVVRPSSSGNPLLPTAVMRKTLQRSDTSGSLPGSSSSTSSTPAPAGAGGLLEGVMGMEREAEGFLQLYHHQQQQQQQLPPPRTMDEEHQRYLMLQQQQQQLRQGHNVLPPSLLNFQRLNAAHPSYADDGS
ncbi:YLP motif-containing protein 1-like isoform X2 [Paramacrobiotus metropolitanus]|uniref:YLP motif-containing protein 1-like isoform X2 n=1 Tax=Paramacrobiotus metropolitanus TaxID=2943436 RepID=UPI002445E889|nr:YLP motif-containing protein 1-like isoform X2 [Paramacrobiotus metropolitanus]